MLLTDDFHNSTKQVTSVIKEGRNANKYNCCGGEKAETVNEDIVSWAVCVVFQNC